MQNNLQKYIDDACEQTDATILSIEKSFDDFEHTIDRMFDDFNEEIDALFKGVCND